MIKLEITVSQIRCHDSKFDSPIEYPFPSFQTRFFLSNSEKNSNEAACDLILL